MSIRRNPQARRGPQPTLKYGDVFGNYVINGFAGTGATSYVYRARRADSFEPVAIKVMHPHLLGDAVKRRRFIREAEVMMRLRHPNVVRFEEILEIDGHLAFVMEYVEGETLTQWRDAHAGEIDEQTLACVFVDLLRGLSLAHRAGIVHRDLKPANVLISWQDGRYVAKIIDFGVARLVDEALAEDEKSSIVGTAAYISPEEVVDPEAVCPASDLYSLGVMMYEAACGQRPFTGRPVGELLTAHVSEAPQRPRALNPGISPGFESVILRTLEKDPEGRFASAPEMIRALEIALSSAMEMTSEEWERAALSDQVTTEWHRAVEREHERRTNPLVSFMRRCFAGAMLVFSTGTTGRHDDPHHLARGHDHHLPLG